MVLNKSYTQLNNANLSFSLFSDLRYSLISVVEPLILLKFSLKDLMYNKSRTKFTNLYLFWLSNLSIAKISLPTYHISYMTLVLPFCVNSLVMSIINKITSWLFKTSKSNILEKFSVVIHDVNSLHSKNRKWIDNTYNKSCWFWMDFYIVSFINISSYFCKCCLLSTGLLKNLINCSTR